MSKAPTLTLPPQFLGNMARASRDVGTVMQNMAADLRGAPRPPRVPYRREYSRMTARQYRADRRRYCRERRAYAKAMQDWTPDRSRMARTMSALAEAFQKSQAKAEASR